jgi:hypothetical protein
VLPPPITAAVITTINFTDTSAVEGKTQQRENANRYPVVIPTR